MKRTLALVPVFLFAGCLPGAEIDLGPGPVDEPLIGGVYQIESDFDLTAASVLPEFAADAYAVLEGLRENPASTLVDVLSDAGVPFIDDLYGALPGALSSRIEGWMNDYINRTPLGEVIDLILSYGDSVLTRFTLVSEVDLDLATMCQSTPHRLLAFQYDVGATTLVVPIGDLPSPPFTTSTNVEACVSPSDVADAELSLDAHTFGLPYGQYVYAALEMAVEQNMGGSVRAVIAQTIDCPGLAQSVAQKCVLGICVGHQQELNELCEAGVEEVVNQLRTRIEAMSFDAVHLESGTANMFDAIAGGGARDGIIDRIEAGTWDASVDFGLGPRTLPARFRATRLVLR